MSTTNTTRPVGARERGHAVLLGIFQRLPDQISEPNILPLLNRLGGHPGFDRATARAVLHDLVAGGALTTHQVDGKTMYHKGVFPEPLREQDVGPGSAHWNDNLRKDAAEFEEQLRRADAVIQAPHNRERNDLMAFVDGRIEERVAELVDERLAALGIGQDGVSARLRDKLDQQQRHSE